MVQTRPNLPDRFSALPQDLKQQLATHKLYTAHDPNAPYTCVDACAWFNALCVRLEASLPKVARTLDELQNNAYLDQSIALADIASYLLGDENLICAALLFFNDSTDVFNDSTDESVRTIIDDARTLANLQSLSGERNLQAVYKMILSTTNDVRAVLLKIAERTLVIRHSHALDDDAKLAIAREVMHIYAPLAHRLGIAQIKWELEDLAFRIQSPIAYSAIAKKLAQKRGEREQYIAHIEHELAQKLADTGVNAEISGRVKHIYSIFKKMQKKQLSFEQLYDIRAVRILAPELKDCYYALGIVHEMWRHIQGQFDDYITSPKPNGYRSLHTVVVAHGKTLEVQIRTFEMHFEAELGKCAHVQYKEGGKSDAFLSQKIKSLRDILSGDAQSDALNDENSDESVYVFTKDGNLIELPKGATVLDFAYYVHTQIGNRATGASVNGRYVPLNYQVRTGEQVQIITGAREPNRDWLISALGYINTNRARAKLRQWFNRQDKDKNIQSGQSIWANFLEKSGESADVLPNYMAAHGHSLAEQFYLALGVADISAIQLQQYYLRTHNHATPSFSTRKKSSGTLGICLDGLDNVEYHLARCCTPIFGEPIAGFLTKSSGISIHKSDCLALQKMTDARPERAVTASWGDGQKLAPVVLVIVIAERRGLVKDIMGIIDKEKINALGVQIISQKDGFAHIKVSVEVMGVAQLQRLTGKFIAYGALSVQRQNQ